MGKKEMADWVAVMEGPPEEIGLAEWTDKVLALFERKEIKLDEKNWNMAMNQLSGFLSNETKFENKYPNQQHGKSSLDIADYSGIWKDNLTTIRQVYLGFYHFTGRKLSDRDSLMLFRTIAQHRPELYLENEDLNKGQKTWLEILAKAQFGSYGGPNFFDMLREMSCSLDSPDKLLPPEAVVAITTGNNGGCPALHLKFKHLELIHRLGLLFYKNMESWFLEKHGPEVLAEITAIQIRTQIKCPHHSK